MNNYRLLGLSVLGIFLLLIILTFQFESDGERLILTYEVGVKYSIVQFRIFIIAYSVILSGLSFWTGHKATLAVRSYWLYVSLVIVPLIIFTLLMLIPGIMILAILTYRGRYPQDYYDYINDYGIFNICLIILNVLGLIIFGFQTIKKLK